MWIFSEKLNSNNFGLKRNKNGTKVKSTSIKSRVEPNHDRGV